MAHLPVMRAARVQCGVVGKCRTTRAFSTSMVHKIPDRTSTTASRKDMTFAMRALAHSGVVQIKWTGCSFLDGDFLMLSKSDCHATHMSPLDTVKVSVEDLEKSFYDAKTDESNTIASVLEKHPKALLHYALHKLSGRSCCIVVNNLQSSWLAAQKEYRDRDCLPAWELQCAMFAQPGDIPSLDIHHADALMPSSSTRFDEPSQHAKSMYLKTMKGCILPNYATAVFGSNVMETTVKAMYLDYAIRAMQSIYATGGRDTVEEIPAAECARLNTLWDTSAHYNGLEELTMLRSKMELPQWWDKMELIEYEGGNPDELQVVAASDLAPETVIGLVGGRVFPDPTKYTIRLATNRHLHMSDGHGSSGTSVFTRINHSFTPNLRCTPMPESEQVEFRALRRIAKGEPLSFDYTTTEEPLLASPFVDLETGKPVGMP
eukprot:m.62504 g.62504  ORF g.62504 m.62504 type:complete len:432 (+) comp15808_c0_seq1:132-1427(+)